MIKLIDSKAELKFIPSSEKDAENPTTFIIRPSSNRDTIKSFNLFDEKINPNTGMVERSFSKDDNDWFEYLANRIIRIENVGIDVPDGKTELATIQGIKEIKSALADMSEAIGAELFTYLVATSRMTDKQIKN